MGVRVGARVCRAVVAAGFAFLLGCADDATGGVGETDTDAATSSVGGSQTDTMLDTDGGTSTGADGSSTGADGTTPQDALAKLIEARCGWVFECCASGEAALAVGPFTTDAADCVDRTMQVLSTGNQMPPVTAGPTDLFVLLAHSYAAGNLLLVDEAVAACAEELAAEACNEPPPEDEDEDEPQEHCSPGDELAQDACALDQLAQGQLPEGSPCALALGVECAAGLACVKSGDAEGTCVAASEVGDFCFSDSHCTPPLYCDLQTGQCAKGGDLGEPCAYENPDNPVPGSETMRCAPGLVCDPVGLTCVGTCALGAPCGTNADCPIEHQCVAGRCSQPQPAGAPCQFGADCETGVCLPDLTCAPISADGSPCLVHHQCESGFCHVIDGVCSPTQGDGEPCTSYSDVECAGGVCDHSNPDAPVCVVLGGPGDACTNTQECNAELDLTCINQVCVEQPLPNGEACAASSQCASGLCWEAVCDDPAMAGDPCSPTGDPMLKPCATDLFCDAQEAEGVCTPKLLAGEQCGADQHCWGSCEVSWGALRCDATPAEGEAICDGA